MRVLMLLFQPFGDESFLAEITLVRFDSCVRHFVAQPIRTVGEGHVAVPAREGPLSGMYPLMVHQFGLHPETLLTDVAFKWPLSFVHHHVPYQILLLKIRLTANVAHELSGSRMALFMCLQ